MSYGLHGQWRNGAARCFASVNRLSFLGILQICERVRGRIGLVEHIAEKP
jgi:hypothetical protein